MKKKKKKKKKRRRNKNKRKKNKKTPLLYGFWLWDCFPDGICIRIP